MDRAELIGFIKANDPFYSDAVLIGYSEAELYRLHNRITRRKAGKKTKICKTCNGSGTVLNIECASCTGSGTAAKAD